MQATVFPHPLLIEYILVAIVFAVVAAGVWNSVSDTGFRV